MEVFVRVVAERGIGRDARVQGQAFRGGDEAAVVRVLARSRLEFEPATSGGSAD